MIDPDKTVIVEGPPGTGKTTYLLGIVEEALARGVPPDRIGYLSFTKKAVQEAIDRACSRFNLKPRMLPYFRTLHSLAFWSLGLQQSQVMGRDHLRELSDLLGLSLSGMSINVDDGLLNTQTPDDRLVFLENMARVRGVSARQVWEEFAHDDVDWWQLERLERAIKEYKQSRFILDYTDMLLRYVEKNKSPDLELLVIDEGQDLSEMQWRMVEVLAREAQHVYISGDDDQSIYQWAGASVSRFIGLRGREVKTLNRSYRVPRRVHSLADHIVRSIASRRLKQWQPREVDGDVEWYGHSQHVDMSDGNWLVLARNSYLLKEIEDDCLYHGYWFEAKGKTPVPVSLIDDIRKHEAARKQGADHPVWFEAFDTVSDFQKEYVRAMLRRGEKITKQPRIRLSTIHGAKGGEADNVLLLTDVSMKAYQQWQRNPDDELRVLYVGLTRAKQRLHIVQPSTNLHLPL
jgi:DNA helicase-2/ATP-dependent DNA helicase PcrA